jgi:hypothetical protein
MFTPEQYRAKAVEYGELVKTSTGPNQRREFQKLEQSFTVLADNEQWLADNHQNIVCTAEQGRSNGTTLAGEEETVPTAEQDRSNGTTLAEEEEHVLRCLGAALIMQWNTLPTKLRRELFDNADSMDELLETAALRGQIARFLHRHEDDKGLKQQIDHRPTRSDLVNFGAYGGLTSLFGDVSALCRQLGDSHAVGQGS